MRSNRANRAAKTVSAKLRDRGYNFGFSHGSPHERAAFDSLVRIETAKRKKAAAGLIMARVKLKGGKYGISPKKFVIVK